MSETSVTNTLLRDTLSEMTRKERRSLLATSMVGLVMVKVGLIPTKIQALGVEFEQKDRSSLLFIWGVVVLYFLIAFVVYALSDWGAWYSDFLEKKRQLATPQGSLLTTGEAAALIGSAARSVPSKETVALDGRIRRIEKYFAQPVNVVRAAFDFFLPVLVAAYSLIVLFSN